MSTTATLERHHATLKATLSEIDSLQKCVAEYRHGKLAADDLAKCGVYLSTAIDFLRDAVAMQPERTVDHRSSAPSHNPDDLAALRPAVSSVVN